MQNVTNATTPNVVPFGRNFFLRLENITGRGPILERIVSGADIPETEEPVVSLDLGMLKPVDSKYVMGKDGNVYVKPSDYLLATSESLFRPHYSDNVFSWDDNVIPPRWETWKPFESNNI